jgi:hypothetical protein
MEQLKISREVSLPLDAVTQTLAAIARKGAGKTFLASLIAEQMLDARAQVIVVDPVGNWWGLRVAADGKSKGKDIFIIGGEHGDIPLVPGAGALIARLLVEKPISAVLDISEMRKGERMQFLTTFGEEFFHLKKRQRSPVHLFLEEAQILMPQRFGKEQARMQGAWTDIVRLGRNYGIGETMISQRPQSIDKEVLNMTECLFVLQVNGVQERKALEDWVQEKGADRTLTGELPGLHRGEGFVWSPSWLRMFKKVHILAKTTFDGSSTPEVGKRVKAATLSPVDVEALKEKLQAVVVEAEEDDPKALRRKIVELERKVSVAGAVRAPVSVPVPAPPPPEPELWEPDWDSVCDRWFDSAVKLNEVCAKLHDAIKTVVDATLGSVAVLPRKALVEELRSIPMKCVRGERAWMISGRGPAQVVKFTKPGSPEVFPASPRTSQSATTSPVGRSGSGASLEGLSGPQSTLLERMAEFAAANISSVKLVWLASSVGTTVRARGFEENMRILRNLQLLERSSKGDGSVTLAQAGRGLVGTRMPLSGHELRQKVMEFLSGPQSAYLTRLMDLWPQPVSFDDLALAFNTTVRARGFEENVRTLRSYELVERTDDGLKAADWLYQVDGRASR